MLRATTLKMSGVWDVVCELQLVKSRSGRRPGLGGIGTYMKWGILGDVDNDAIEYARS